MIELQAMQYSRTYRDTTFHVGDRIWHVSGEFYATIRCFDTVNEDVVGLEVDDTIKDRNNSCCGHSLEGRQTEPESFDCAEGLGYWADIEYLRHLEE